MKKALEKIKIVSSIAVHSLNIAAQIFWMWVILQLVLGNWKLVPVMP